MKKTFCQFHPYLYLRLLPFEVLMVMTVVGFITVNDYPSLFIMGPCACFMVVWFCLLVSHHIVFDEKGIHTPTDKGLGKKEKVQYEAHVAYEDIVSVCIVVSSKNSKKRSIDGGGHGTYLNHYFEFTLTSGKKVWIYITYFLKKQLVEMVEIINQHTNLDLDYDHLRENMQKK